jgi:hypothetical protein
VLLRLWLFEEEIQTFGGVIGAVILAGGGGRGVFFLCSFFWGACFGVFILGK